MGNLARLEGLPMSWEPERIDLPLAVLKSVISGYAALPTITSAENGLGRGTCTPLGSDG
jgi:hypothetical protein